jgi:hypothetical protein
MKVVIELSTLSQSWQIYLLLHPFHRKVSFPLLLIRIRASAREAAVEEMIDPIKTFVSGTTAQSYGEIRRFLHDQSSNLSHGDPLVSALRAAAQSDSPYRGQVMPAAVSALHKLQTAIGQRLEAARAEAIARIEDREANVKAHPRFETIDSEQKEAILGISAGFKEQLQREALLPVIADTLRRYQEVGFPRQMERLTHTPKKYPEGAQTGKEKTVSETAYTSIHNLVEAAVAGSGKTYLTNEAEVETFVRDLESRLKQLVSEGNGITL